MMRFIDERSLERLGYKNLLSRVDVLSPYGKEKLNNLKFFVEGEEEILKNEFERMEKFKNFFDENPKVKSDIESKIHCLKNIRNSIKNSGSLLFDVVDLCEVKVQLRTVRDLANIFNKYEDIFDYVMMPNIVHILEELDPRREDSPTFYIYDEYSDDLKNIRIQKKEIERKIFSSKNYEQVKELKDERLAIVLLEEEIEAKIRTRLTKLIEANAELILECIDNIATIDLLIAKINFAKEYGGVKPEVSKDKKIKLKGMINIELREILEEQGKKYTGIDIELSQGATVITGANMGGKSVALNTITENILLFHMGFYPFGESASIPLFNYVFFVSDDMQDLSKGLSTFGSEIIKLKEINVFVKMSDGFVVFDEFARGTNPQEGQKFVKALVKYLNLKSSISLITTHFDGVIPEDVAHYQVVGLKNLDFSALKNKMLANKNSIEIIQECMDFRLEKSTNKEVPKDALNIARLIGLDDEISKMILKEYKEEEITI